MPKETPPATVIQLAAALAALGAYNGTNTAAEHAAEAKHLGGGEAYYRMRLANALLGNAELQATLAETAEGPEDGILLAHEQALESAGVTHSTATLLEFLCWRTLRVEGPLRQLAQDRATGPIPVAASWAAEGLRLLLGVTAAGQRLDPATFSPEAMKADLNQARDAFLSAIDNLDIMFSLIATAEEMAGRPRYPRGGSSF